MPLLFFFIFLARRLASFARYAANFSGSSLRNFLRVALRRCFASLGRLHDPLIPDAMRIEYQKEERRCTLLPPLEHVEDVESTQRTVLHSFGLDSFEQSSSHDEEVAAGLTSRLDVLWSEVIARHQAGVMLRILRCRCRCRDELDNGTRVHLPQISFNLPKSLALSARSSALSILASASFAFLISSIRGLL